MGTLRQVAQNPKPLLNAHETFHFTFCYRDTSLQEAFSLAFASVSVFAVLPECRIKPVLCFSLCLDEGLILSYLSQ